MSHNPMLSHIPNLIYLDPSSREEYRQMLHYATTQRKHPVAIRVPIRFRDGGEDTTDYSLTNRARVVQQGQDVAVITTGALLPLAEQLATAYESATGHRLTLIHPRFLTGVDGALLDSLPDNHRLVITLEDGELEGGYGQRIASHYGLTGIKVANFGISKAFHSNFKAETLLAENGISVEKLLQFIQKEI